MSEPAQIVTDNPFSCWGLGTKACGKLVDMGGTVIMSLIFIGFLIWLVKYFLGELRQSRTDGVEIARGYYVAMTSTAAVVDKLGDGQTRMAGQVDSIINELRRK